MKALVFALFLVSTAAVAEDARQLVKLPAPAQEALREEMQGNLVALNDVLSLIAAGKIKEAGEAAETKLGMSAMGRHRDKPFDARPGPHMPPAMHGIGMEQDVRGWFDVKVPKTRVSRNYVEQALSAVTR